MDALDLDTSALYVDLDVLEAKCCALADCALRVLTTVVSNARQARAG